MQVICLDTETYFDKDYTLSKLTTEEYIRDPRFAAHGVGVRLPDGTLAWYASPRDAEIDWQSTAVLCHHCLRGDVEVLTPNGWVRLDAFVDRPGPVMQWDPATARLSWTNPSHVQSGVSDRMLHWSTTYHDCYYTEEHRMYYATPNVPAWRVQTARQVAEMGSNNVYIPLSGFYEDPAPLELSPLEACLMEAIRADGSWQMHGDKFYGFRFSLKKTRKIERLIALLNLLSIPFSLAPRGDGAWRLLASRCPISDRIFHLLGREKKYGKWVMRLSYACRHAILVEAQHWDGHHTRGKRANSYVLGTIHEENAEAFQLMAHLSGWMCHYDHKSNNRGFTAGKKYARLYFVNIRERRRAKTIKKPETVIGTFPIYCLTVPTGAFLVRSNGTVFATGNSQFDGLILSHHYGIKPAFWLDTLSMARIVLGNHISASLDSLAKHFGIGYKSLPYDDMQGKHLDDMSLPLQQEVADGCLNDVQLTYQLFCILVKDFPRDELLLIDSTIRAFTEPVLIGDTPRLAAIWEEEQTRKQKLLAELSVNGSDLRSEDGFRALLEVEGVAVETKVTAKGNTKACFAKTDDFMQALVDDPNPRIAALAQARLAQRSSIVQTRAERLGWMSTRGPMCVYLAYGGAHTTRWSGGDKLNWQNFPRDSALGEAIHAPEGHVCVVADASSIECRILLALAGQEDMLDAFREGRDLYCEAASRFYHRTITKADPKERGLGKLMTLSAGFGAAWRSIQRTARRGTYGPPITLTDQEAQTAQHVYRDAHPEVVGLWQEANVVLYELAERKNYNWRGCLKVHDGKIILPNGLKLDYTTLEANGSEWTVANRHGRVRIYGAKLVENVIQALARVHTAGVWVRMVQAGIRIVSMEHDKLIAVVPEQDGAQALDMMRRHMAMPPAWMPHVPLGSEGYVSRSFKTPA